MVTSAGRRVRGMARPVMAGINRKLMALSKDPGDKARLGEEIERKEKPESDAWGHEILLHFDAEPRTAVFGSFGQDGKRGSPDDIMCIVKGQRNRDTLYERTMWDYTKEWHLPEGLQPAIDRAVKDKEDRAAKFVKAVN